MRRLLPALLLLASCALAQDRAAAPQKKWKDQAEYEIANAAARETDPARKLVYLNTWTANYPATEFIDIRQSMYATVNQQLKRPSQALDTTPVPPVLKVEAQYTDEARLAGLEGSVWVTGTVAADGSMQNPHVDRPLGLGLDEQAIAAAAQLRFASGSQQPRTGTVPIDFTLPSKQSRWHLVEAEFKTPAGASRPTFAAADYPLGPGIGLAAYDEALLLSAIGRAASATVSFDIDERGYPGNFLVVNASAREWGPEAVGVVQSWRFHPGIRAGMPVSVPCTLSLVWGPEEFKSRAIAGQLGVMYPPPPPPPAPQLRAERWPESAMISKTAPEYTEEARRAELEGSVWISLNVDEQGTPVKAVVDGPLLGMGLEVSALEAVKQWRFQPRILNGQPVVVPLTVQVNFRLTGVESSVFITPPVAVAAAPKPK
jgi:TonB family protein